MSERGPENRYDDRNIVTMETVYGEGYLSAGGDAEVALILRRAPVRGKRVLDVGCGLGGAAVTLVRDHGAAHVQGVDIDAAVLARARSLVERQGVAARVSLLQTKGGPLPFDPGSFDVVYANAVSCHIRELDVFFGDIMRVLAPGGCLVGNEWFKASENHAFRVWDELLRERGLYFYFVTREAFAAALMATGFETPVMTDRTQAFTELAHLALRRVDNELQDDLVHVLGEEGYQAFREWTGVRHAALADGGMHQGHFLARKPEPATRV